MKAQPVTCERLKEVIHYNPETGAFTWMKRISIRIMVGQSADCSNGDGYLAIGIDGGKYKAHRLAWLYMTGEHPIDEMDHINGIRTDNRWVNLRQADRSVNSQNRRRARKDNKLGLLGVSEHEAGFFYSRIYVKGKQRRLGCYATAQEAHAAYLAAKRQLHPGNTL